MGGLRNPVPYGKGYPLDGPLNSLVPNDAIRRHKNLYGGLILGVIL